MVWKVCLIPSSAPPHPCRGFARTRRVLRRPALAALVQWTYDSNVVAIQIRYHA